jgi:hypothetical protein
MAASAIYLCVRRTLDWQDEAQAPYAPPEAILHGAIAVPVDDDDRFAPDLTERIREVSRCGDQSATSPRKIRLTSADWSSSADGPDRIVRPDSMM